MVIGWVVLFLLIDWKVLHINIWGGIAACILQLIHDTEQDIMNNFHVFDTGIPIMKSSLFFTFGVVFTMGIIFLQFLPQNKILKIIHLLAFSIGFLVFEYLAIKNGMLKYIHYNIWISFLDDVFVLATLAWTKSFVLSTYTSIERQKKRC